MSSILPSAKEIFEEAIQINPSVNVNELHEKTYRLMLKYRDEYYQRRIDRILSIIDIDKNAKMKIRKEFMKPIIVNNKKYSNMMEETSRRVSQAFQPLSGALAELCAEREINMTGLKTKIHYDRRDKKTKTDLLIYHPDKSKIKKTHRVEVKNVKMRERGTRGLAFDGDSLFGFFNASDEFSKSNIDFINDHCKKTGGYCYIPHKTLKQIKFQSTLFGSSHRFKSNTEFGSDMLSFAKKGVI